MRTISQMVTFIKPFALNGDTETLPPGSYNVETDEELLEGLSFLAYRRISTRLHLGTEPGNRILDRVITVDPNELEAALARDRVAAARGSEPGLDEMLADPMVRLIMYSDALSEEDVRRTLHRRHPIRQASSIAR